MGYSDLTILKKYFRRNLLNIVFAFFGIFFFIQISNGQYFNGPNKPAYKIFNYRVYNTPHFEIYHYTASDSLIKALGEDAEKWYDRHQAIFKDTFKVRNPILFYNNHADFQQTNAIMGNIGIGTGGVTEALKNRVVLPIMDSKAQTDHVLGHEMVHAFQYRLILGDDSTQMRNIRNIPLWMVEGMAEYLSIGSFDPNTAMWMRDAIINNDFPTLEDLTKSYKYFPYRYGQAFWAYVSGLYGDSLIIPLFDLTTRYGYEIAVDSIICLNEKVFSAVWKKTTKDYYFQFLKDTIEKPTGKKILYEKNSGTINIAPSLSPDGKYVAFISEKDLFSFDLYLADAFTGKIIHKLSSTIRDNKIDDFNFLESGGTWSPDSKEFAFVVFSKGRNKLLIINVNKPRKFRELDVPGVDAFSNPAWSPDGTGIVVSGLIQGVTDLYLFDLTKKKVEKLTNDVYCNLMPNWSSDGKYIVFSTDEFSSAMNDTLIRGYRIGLINVQTREKKILNVFNGADNLNPQFSPDAKWIYFLSDADGFRNLFKYSMDSGKTYRLTHLITGISGVTEFTPAFSIDRQMGNIVYIHYFKSDYSLYQAMDSSFKAEYFPNDSMNFAAAHLPPSRGYLKSFVDNNIAGITKEKPLPVDSFKHIPYRHKFRLDYIGGSSLGVGVSSYYGTGLAGSVDMLFSDIVGDYQLYSSLAINGQIYDFGGSIAFINNRNKIDWGVSFSHIPYNYNYADNPNRDSIQMDSIRFLPLTKYPISTLTIFEDAFTMFAIKPLSQTQRIEAYTSFSYYSYRLDRINYSYDSTGELRKISREYNLPTPNGFGIGAIGTAYTLDNAYMGIASPLRGQRFRLEIERYFGELGFNSLLIDYRKYLFINPFCIATRLYHLGRYGSIATNSSTKNVIQALYIGWPWMVRGFGFSYIDKISSDSVKLNQLFGSRIAVANLELRIPFTGPARLCLIPFKYFVSELSFFLDGGIAWDSSRKLKFRTNDFANYSTPVGSCGVSLRVNFFGVMILEPYYAIPLQKDAKYYAGFGFNFLPGW
jgi:hypothetical protein